MIAAIHRRIGMSGGAVPALANHDAPLVGRGPDVRVLVESTRLRLLEYGRLAALSGDKKPDSIDLRVPPRVAAAVARAAIETCVAQIPVEPREIEVRCRDLVYEGTHL